MNQHQQVLQAIVNQLANTERQYDEKVKEENSLVSKLRAIIQAVKDVQSAIQTIKQGLDTARAVWKALTSTQNFRSSSHV